MKQSAIIIAHGQPSDPEPAEATMALLAGKVSALLPGWRVGSATLAAPDSLRTALQNIDNTCIFPFFMADGWFVRSLLPQRLAEAGARAPRILRPFGLLEATKVLAARIAVDAAQSAGWSEGQTTLILAAHGSGRSRFPSQAAGAIATGITTSCGFAEVRTGFIEEAPILETVARGAGKNSLCLPLFAARWGHVATDIPAALASAGFAGVVLDPIGEHETVPTIIAAALSER